MKKLILVAVMLLVAAQSFAAELVIPVQRKVKAVWTYDNASFTMTAVDASGNESAHSEPFIVTIPEGKFRLYQNGLLICETADTAAREMTCDTSLLIKLNIGASE